MNLWDENIAEIPPNMDPIPPHTQHPTPAFTHLRDAAHHTSFQTYFFLTPWTFYEDIDMIPSQLDNSFVPYTGSTRGRDWN